jgi:CRISPR-associated protein Csd2
MSDVIANRYEFLFLFDCENGNPNGDPDAANAPRIDPQDMRGLVSDVALKRRVRNYVLVAKGGKEPYRIFIEQSRNLNVAIARSYEEGQGGIPQEPKVAQVKHSQAWLCERYFDIRCFGAVLSTGPKAGQVRGPVQLTFAKSVDAVLPLDLCLTRVAKTINVANAKTVAEYQQAEDSTEEAGLREMGRKTLIPYGLYVAKGFISANLARNTGFGEDDLKLLWQSILNMYEHDRSASKGLMSVYPDAAFVFKHVGTDSNLEQRKQQAVLGCAPAHKLFNLVTDKLKKREGVTAPRGIGDYVLPTLDVVRSGCPAGVEVDLMSALL